MERLINQSHNKTAFVYAGSRLFERAGYYGLRAILVLYMISESIKMSEIEALKLYGTFTASVMLSQIVGALFGDLILGNRKAVIIGGALQAFGAFFFCIPSAMGMYIGLFLVALGDGLYTPNMISNFCKLYLSKPKLLDAGFAFFYVALNIEAFMGAFLLGYFETAEWKILFMAAGLMFLISIAFPLFPTFPTIKIQIAYFLQNT